MEPTEEERSRKRRRCNSVEQNPNLNSDPTVANGSDSSAFQASTNSQNLEFVEDPLSNFTILRHIFTFLDDRDLETCSNVNKCWRIVADPLILTHFDIKLDTSDVPRENPRTPLYNIGQVREMAHYNRKRFTEYVSNLKDITQRLEKVLLTEKISITLEISSDVDIEEDEIMNFISKFGIFVLGLTLNFIKMSVVDFCKLMVRNFPNLKKLHCSRLRLEISTTSTENQYFYPESSQVKHKKLRKITFGQELESNALTMETMLKTFERLEEIENFPIELVNQIVFAQNAEVVKSYSHFGSQFFVLGEKLVASYEKLAGLRPKLTSLRLKPERMVEHEPINPYLFSILQSSQESLKSLLITSVKPEEVQHFPTLKELKTLELEQRNLVPGGFFPPEMSLTDKFPNVTNLCLWKASVEYIVNNFPESKILPWGSQIIHLNVGLLEEFSLPLLRKFFPSIQGLGIRCPSTQIPNLLKQIPNCWPQLASLSFMIGYECHKERWRKGRMLRLDHAFTGLPEHVIDQLGDPFTRKFYTQEQIQGFKDKSLISKLKELKEMELVLEDPDYRVGVGGTGTSIRLSPVAHEFGFSLLPDLKVTAKIESYSRYSKAIIKNLEPSSAPCGNLKNGGKPRRKKFKWKLGD